MVRTSVSQSLTPTICRHAQQLTVMPAKHKALQHEINGCKHERTPSCSEQLSSWGSLYSCRRF